jgi:adenine-specific DNA-methyltransferase
MQSKSKKTTGEKSLPRNRPKLQKVEILRSKTKGTRRPTRAARFLEGDILTAIKKIPKNSCDLIISSPPYNIGKDYERSSKLSFEEYLEWQNEVIAALTERLRDSGSICWQVGSYVKDGESFPLDVHFYHCFKARGLKLRNRIIWKFNFGLNSKMRLSGRYETILWFTKGDQYKFNLDPIRIKQLYPGKRHAKTRKNGSGLPSGNPLGKNPGDFWEFSAAQHFLKDPIWDIPNVKANHPEKTFHQCQFPIELVERCVLALTKKGDTVLDPFVGTGTSVIAAIKHERRGIGIDKVAGYLELARKRVASFRKGKLKIRPLGRPIHRPKPTDKVAIRPKEWSA